MIGLTRGHESKVDRATCLFDVLGLAIGLNFWQVGGWTITTVLLDVVVLTRHYGIISSGQVVATADLP